MGVSDLVTIHPSVRKDSACTNDTHNLPPASEQATGKNQRTLNRSCSMPDIIVCIVHVQLAFSHSLQFFPCPKDKVATSPNRTNICEFWLFLFKARRFKIGDGLEPLYQLNQHTGGFGEIFLSINLTQGFLCISNGGVANTFFFLLFAVIIECYGGFLVRSNHYKISGVSCEAIP